MNGVHNQEARFLFPYTLTLFLPYIFTP